MPRRMGQGTLLLTPQLLDCKKDPHKSASHNPCDSAKVFSLVGLKGEIKRTQQENHAYQQDRGDPFIRGAWLAAMMAHVLSVLVWLGWRWIGDHTPEI